MSKAPKVNKQGIVSYRDGPVRIVVNGPKAGISLIVPGASAPRAPKAKPAKRGK